MKDIAKMILDTCIENTFSIAAEEEIDRRAISRLKTKTISYTSIYFLLFVTTNAFLPRTSSQKKSNNETKNDECVK